MQFHSSNAWCPPLWTWLRNFYRKSSTTGNKRKTLFSWCIPLICGTENSSDKLWRNKDQIKEYNIHLWEPFYFATIRGLRFASLIIYSTNGNTVIQIVISNLGKCVDIFHSKSIGILSEIFYLYNQIVIWLSDWGLEKV